MKTIVICGGGRNVGKTTLARAFVRHLPGAQAVKLGHHLASKGLEPQVFPLDTSFEALASRFKGARYLVIESGSILEDPNCRPELVIFLPAPEGDKPGSENRRARAHLVREETQMDADLDDICARLGASCTSLRAALASVGTFVKTRGSSRYPKPTLT